MSVVHREVKRLEKTPGQSRLFGRPLRIVLYVSGILIPGLGSAQTQTVNPHEGDPVAIRAGRVLYADRCAMCHGADARGMIGMGPDLVGLWVSGKGDGDVFSTIRVGVPGSVMPSSSAPDGDLWAMVAFLRSLGTVPPWNTEGGDAARGGEIFASTCASCHRLNGRGGRLGPDLTRIAATRSREATINEIRDPSASIASAYRSVTLVIREGERRVRGVVKNEDSFSIQIMDTEERLQGYGKADVEIADREGSLMPAFGPNRLTEPDLNHVLAYLASLAESDSDSR